MILKSIRKGLFWIGVRVGVWQILSASRANRMLKEEDEDKKHNELVKNWLNFMRQKKIDVDFLADQVDELYDSEVGRRNAIEAKASSLLGVVGLALTLTSIGFALNGQESITSGQVAKVALVAIVVAVVYFVASGYYAARVRELRRLWTSTTSSFRDVMSSAQNAKLEMAARRLADIDMNYSVTLTRSNMLSMSQDLLLRALFFLGSSLVLLLLARLFNVTN